MSQPTYYALDPQTIPAAISAIDGIGQKLGGSPDGWKIREVGDGNLNLVFIVEGPSGGLVVKQALPYVRLVGESWPLPLDRAYYEANALRIQTQHAPGLTPAIYYTDRNMALIVMEYLHPHIVLRKGLVKGIRYPLAASAIAKFMAKTLFNTSVLASSAAEHKQRIALFAPNTALCKITEDLVFTDPYRVASLNRWTRPFLDAIKAQFENDVPLKLAVQHKKWQFLTQAEALIHGDLHAGSIMVTQTDTRIIDPEFAFVGPMAFDVGAVIGNFLLAYFAHRGQLTRSVDGDYPNWLLSQIEAIWQQFEDRFVACWKSQQAGDVYAQDLFDATSAQHLFEQQRKSFMLNLFQESLQFAGCKMIRRILGLAHVEDMESIVDPQIRARCETLALHFGRELVLHGKTYTTIQEVTAAAAASLTPRELSP